MIIQSLIHSSKLHMCLIGHPDSPVFRQSEFWHRAISAYGILSIGISAYGILSIPLLAYSILAMHANRHIHIKARAKTNNCVDNYAK